MEALEPFVTGKSPFPGGAGLLTSRERQIVQLIVDGLNNEAIAARLGTTGQTVKNQLTVIFAKLHVRSRVQLAVHALRCGLAT